MSRSIGLPRRLQGDVLGCGERFGDGGAKAVNCQRTLISMGAYHGVVVSGSVTRSERNRSIGPNKIPLGYRPLIPSRR
jgi:hypothetical protein